MAHRNFPGKSQAWLEAELAKVLDELASGQTVTAAGAGDANMSGEAQVGIQARRDLLLWDLYVLAPGTYSLETIRRPTATTAVFRDV